jgi:hypothetical protein
VKLGVLTAVHLEIMDICGGIDKHKNVSKERAAFSNFRVKDEDKKVLSKRRCLLNNPHGVRSQNNAMEVEDRSSRCLPDTGTSLPNCTTLHPTRP